MAKTDFAAVPESMTEPWLLVEEITHRVLNEYAIAIGSISRAAAHCDSVDAKLALSSAIKRLLANASVHRALQPPLNLEVADLGEHLRALCGAIVRANLAERNIRLTFEGEGIELDATRCWLVGLIVSELINNAARHGLKARGGNIVVEIISLKDAIGCRVTDNGTCVNPIPGRGTRIVRALALQLGGRIEWHFGSRGTTALVYLPSDGHTPTQGNTLP